MLRLPMGTTPELPKMLPSYGESTDALLRTVPLKLQLKGCFLHSRKPNTKRHT